MKIFYILFLFPIFTNYLFSQIEKNGIIKTDTIVRVDTIVVEQQEKKDFKQYDFYNDYLPNLPKTNKSDDLKINDDTLPTINDSTKITIFSAKLGLLLLWLNASVALDIPINYNSNFVAKYFYFAALDVGGNSKYWKGFGLGLGVVTKKTDNVIIKYNICPSLVISDKDHGEKVGFGLNVGMDIILLKALSIGLETTIIDRKGGGDYLGFIPLLTVGLNFIKICKN